MWYFFFLNISFLSLVKKKWLQGSRSRDYGWFCTCAILCCVKKISQKKYGDWIYNLKKIGTDLLKQGLDVYFLVFAFFVKWCINLNGLFNAKAIILEDQKVIPFNL